MLSYNGLIFPQAEVVAISSTPLFSGGICIGTKVTILLHGPTNHD